MLTILLTILFTLAFRELASLASRWLSRASASAPSPASASAPSPEPTPEPASAPAPSPAPSPEPEPEPEPELAPRMRDCAICFQDWPLGSFRAMQCGCVFCPECMPRLDGCPNRCRITVPDPTDPESEPESDPESESEPAPSLTLARARRAARSRLDARMRDRARVLLERAALMRASLVPQEGDATLVMD